MTDSAPADLVSRITDIAADPSAAPRVHELLHLEAGRVIEALRGPAYSAAVGFSAAELEGRVARIEELVEPLARSLSIVTYWSPPGDARVLAGVLNWLANGLDRSSGLTPWLDLYLYPAVLSLYTAGLAAVVGRRERTLAEVLLATSVYEHGHPTPGAAMLHPEAAVDHQLAQQLPGLERRHTPMSDHLVDVLRPWLTNFQPHEMAFELAFDRFEYLLGLSMFDATRAGGNGGYAYVGRLSWRGERGVPIETSITEEIASAAAQWPLLAGGLFGRDVARLSESAKAWNARIAEIRRHQF
jgi:hypothetical protein